MAARLAAPENIDERVVAPGWFFSLPLPLMPVRSRDRADQANSPLTGAPPDLILASGRRTIPYLKAIRKIREAPRNPLIVFLKDPRTGRRAADFVWAPVHDGLSGENVISTHTSPHTLTPEALKGASESAKVRFADYPGPATGIIVGGDSGSVKWNGKSGGELAEKLRAIPKAGSVLVTGSRRTPAVLYAAVREAVHGHQHWAWTGNDANPYAEILAHADRFIVTGDSHNMVSESLASGKCVYVHRPPGLQKKLHSFLDAMVKMGAVRDFNGTLPEFEPVKMDATAEIAAAIEQALARE